MPKKRFGPRPVTVAAPAARVAYLALVNHLGDSLGPKSREDGNWEEFRAFAIRSEAEYVVKFDIASFYEYIDHGILKRQLLSHTLDPALVRKLENSLGSVIGGARGLPQLFPASDHLSDVYIGPLERRLVRDGYSVVRYVDDFIAASDSWETANFIVERAAEYAREIGLVLSSEKTSITKRATLISAEQSEAQFINKYLEAAQGKVSQVLFWGDYDDMELEQELIDDETIRETMWNLVHHWREVIRSVEPEDSFETEGHFRGYLSNALGWLRNYDGRISDEILHEIVFKHPLFLVGVCGYIVARSEAPAFTDEDPWRTLSKLAIMGRQSPWAKLWLLESISRIHIWKKQSADYEAVMEWVHRQLDDRHEVVRVQAAWAVACHGRFSEHHLVKLYTQATSISQPALAACMGKQGGFDRKIVNSITGDGSIMRKACEWAQANEDSEI